MLVFSGCRLVYCWMFYDDEFENEIFYIDFLNKLDLISEFVSGIVEEGKFSERIYIIIMIMKFIVFIEFVGCRWFLCI